jgi:hypothetical protein
LGKEGYQEGRAEEVEEEDFKDGSRIDLGPIEVI